MLSLPFTYQRNKRARDIGICPDNVLVDTLTIFQPISFVPTKEIFESLLFCMDLAEWCHVRVFKYITSVI